MWVMKTNNFAVQTVNEVERKRPREEGGGGGVKGRVAGC